MTPVFDLHAAAVLESAEAILSSTGVAAEIAFANLRRGSDPPLSAPAVRAIEICPPERDATHAPQSYPAVRLFITSSTTVGTGVAAAIANVAHRLEVRVFSATSDRMTTLTAAGKRTVATSASVRASIEAGAIRTALARDLVQYTINGDKNNVFNVGVIEHGSTTVYGTTTAGAVLITRIVLDVTQRVRTPRVGYPSFVLGDVATLTGAEHLWVFGAGASTSDTGATGGATLTLSSVSRATTTVPGASGKLDFGGGSPYATASVVQSLNQDRALELVFVLPDEGADDHLVSASNATHQIGALKVVGGALTWEGQNNNTVALIADITGTQDKIIYVLATYDASATLYTIYTRVEDAAETSATLAQATTALGSASPLYFGGYDLFGGVGTMEHDLHHAAVYDTIPSAAHRAAMHARLAL